MKKITIGTAFNQYWYIAVLVLIIFFQPGSNLQAQIYAPEGLNMPGLWNGWVNPPSNNLALASYTQVPGGRVKKINSEIIRWQTSFSVAASGGDIAGGSYPWLFTSGPSGGPFNNKWANVNVVLNTLQSYTKGGANNNNITVTNGKWYTINWMDNGYNDTQAIFMETSAQPVNLLSVSVPSEVAANQPAVVSLTTGAVPSSEEVFYLRYSTTNWVNSSVVLYTMSGSSGTASIPGQTPGAVVKYYAFSSTVAGVTDNYDLYTIKSNDNGGNYYSYTVSGLSSQADIQGFAFAEQTGPAAINPVNATVGIEVAPGTALTALTPAITVSPGASIDPASGVNLDFTNPVTYTVTAEDGTTTKAWTVTATIAIPNYGIRDNGGVDLPTFTYRYTGQGSDITEKGSEFNNKNLGPLSSLIIKGSAIKTWKTGAGDVTGAQFKYKVWSNIGSEPADYTLRNVNWSSDDGDGNQTWADFGSQIDIAEGLTAGSYSLKIFFTISGTGIAGTTQNGPFSGTFEVQALNTEAEILDFVLSEQTGPAMINSGAAAVSIEVANGTVLTALTPTITISAGATINPAGGVSRDFTNPVTYTVTSESGAQKVWTVTVTETAPPSIGWANLQWPPDGNILLNQDFNVFAQVYAGGITNGTGQGAGVQAWIGYSTGNSNPDTWTNWIAASFQGDAGNNDEYVANLGAAMSSQGTFYYASRFKLNDQGYVYGGFQGGFWDGTNNISGVLTVNPPTSKILNLTVLLEGLYYSNGQMNQASGESGPQFGPGIADQITVELHNALNYIVIEHSVPEVNLGTNGSAYIGIPASFSNSYFLTVKHSNSIETTSASPVSFSGPVIDYAFSAPLNAYGGNLLQMSDGQYVVYGGDVNQDDILDTADFSPVDNDQNNYVTGYVVTDVNGSGVVDTSDFSIIDNNQFNFIGAALPLYSKNVY